MIQVQIVIDAKNAHIGLYKLSREDATEDEHNYAKAVIEIYRELFISLAEENGFDTDVSEVSND